jgi:L-fuconolactonase
MFAIDILAMRLSSGVTESAFICRFKRLFQQRKRIIQHRDFANMQRIDAHQHYWKTARTDYGWLTANLGSIYRDFMPDDLATHLGAARIDRTILVQAAPSEAETLFLLDIAEQTPSVAGVVGWIDFEATDAPDRVAQMAKHGVVGLRPMVQDIADTDWLLRSTLLPAIEAMMAHDLRFDALIQPRHLPVLLEFARAYPDLKIIIDHGAKPNIANGAIESWAKGLRALASETDVYCKLSGLVTEAGANWSAETIKPFADILIELFAPTRLVWGSDWPVLNLANDYAAWIQLSDWLLADLSAGERTLVFGGNAARFYGLDD